MAVDLSKIPDLGVNPIPGDEPGGINVQYESDYESVDRAFTKLTSMERGSEDDVQAVGEGPAPSWEKLIEESSELLETRSKNLRVASYLVIALFEESGIPGLSVGIDLTNKFLENFWETMFPPKKLLKGRTSSLEYISTYVAGNSGQGGGLLALRGNATFKEWTDFSTRHSKPAEFEVRYEEFKIVSDAIDAALVSLESIREKIYELFPNDKLPVITALRDALQLLQANYGQEIKKQEQAIAAKKAAAEQAAAAAAAPAATPGALAAAPTPGAAAPTAPSAPSPATVAGPPLPSSITDLTEARTVLTKIAPLLRQGDPSDPAAYRLLRLGVWGGIAKAPPMKTDEETRVPPGAVSASLVEQMQDLVDTSNWMNLLNQTESRLPNAPLWLDQQYHTFRALSGMGSSFDGAARAVMEELAVFIRRVPELPGLAFDGGVAFASESTRAWIDSEVLAAGAGGGGGSVGGGENSGELATALGEARKMAKENRLEDALGLLQRGPQNSSALRERFRWRMGMAQIAQEAGKSRLARPLWEGLLAEIDSHQLEAWEQDSCVTVLKALHRIYKGDKELKPRANDIFERLCRIDATSALSLEK